MNGRDWLHMTVGHLYSSQVWNGWSWKTVTKIHLKPISTRQGMCHDMAIGHPLVLMGGNLGNAVNQADQVSQCKMSVPTQRVEIDRNET